MVSNARHTLSSEQATGQRTVAKPTLWALVGLALSAPILPEAATAADSRGVMAASSAAATSGTVDDTNSSRDADEVLYECEVKVSRANVRTTPNGAVISVLPQHDVVYLYRTKRVDGVLWYEVLRFDVDAEKHIWLGFMAASTLTCYGFPNREW